MRFEEFKGGIQVAVSNAELMIIERINSNIEPLSIESLNETEIELVRQMVSRGLLVRHAFDGVTYYFVNS